MITEQEFLTALDIVKKYQIQISKMVSGVAKNHNTSKTLILDWVKSHQDNPKKGKISTRLFNGLKFYSENRGEVYYYKANEYATSVYIEDITKNEFLQIRNMGESCWIEFCNLTGKEK